MLQQISALGLEVVGADAAVDVVEAGTPLAELYRLCMAAIGPPAVAAGALTSEQASALDERPTREGFRACGFVHVGVWGRRPPDASLPFPRESRGDPAG